jgi:glyoxylase-like metal-dependent hydrolase (beta-lactamase superfamily II)
MRPSNWFECDTFAAAITRIREPGLGPLHAANLWLVAGRDRALLIDAGVGVAPLRPLIESLTDRPVICLLTHSHYDHMGGGHEFSDRRAHPAEAAILADPTPASGTLFTSDALYDGRMFFGLRGSDREAAARSIARLAALPVTSVHPGHGESFDGDRLRALAAETIRRLNSTSGDA